MNPEPDFSQFIAGVVFFGVVVGIAILLAKDSIRNARAPWAREEDRRIAESASMMSRVATALFGGVGLLVSLLVLAAIVMVVLAVLKWAWGILTT